jgi:hypothetical protein
MTWYLIAYLFINFAELYLSLQQIYLREKKAVYVYIYI